VESGQNTTIINLFTNARLITESDHTITTINPQ
jgi:hypothetical protein